MISNNKLIIIGFADALSAPEVAFCLLDAGFRVAAFIRRNSYPPALSKCKAIDLFEISAPENNTYQTIAELKKIYKLMQAAAIMPLNDKALWLCDQLSTNEQIKVAGPISKQAQFSLDKTIQIDAARIAGFNVPETYIIRDTSDVLQVKIFPIVLKPALTVVSYDRKLFNKAGIHFCANKQEFNKAISLWNGRQPLLVQPVHKGVGEGLFGFATENGIFALSAHQRIRMMNPKGSGASACKAMPIIDQPVVETENMLMKLQWRGIFMVELLRDESGKFWFIELNGRPWGSMALALRMGFDYPSWAVMQVIDNTFRPLAPAPHEFVTCRHLGRELVHILYVLRGPNSTAIPNWPSIWQTFFSVFHISKKDRWYNWRPNCTRLFLADTYNTVLGETIHKWIKH